MLGDSQLRSVQSAGSEVDMSQCARGWDHVKFDRWGKVPVPVCSRDEDGVQKRGRTGDRSRDS